MNWNTKQQLFKGSHMLKTLYRSSTTICSDKAFPPHPPRAPNCREEKIPPQGITVLWCSFACRSHSLKKARSRKEAGKSTDGKKKGKAEGAAAAEPPWDSWQHGWDLACSLLASGSQHHPQLPSLALPRATGGHHLYLQPAKIREITSQKRGIFRFRKKSFPSFP